jgi:hypothetical protein
VSLTDGIGVGTIIVLVLLSFFGAGYVTGVRRHR